MLNKLSPKSEFSKSVLTLMSGTIVAQALPIIITPILTRLYTPAEFGILALFVSITIFLGTIVSGRYELAIMLPENNEDAIGIAALGMLITTSMSFMLILPFIIFNQELTILLKNKEIGYWLYFVPFVVWLIGLFNILTYLNNRQKLYSEIAKAQIYKSVTMVTVQLIIGFIQKGALGLVSGQIVSHISSTFRLMKSARKSYQINNWNNKPMKYYLFRYKKFTLYSLPGALLNTGSANLLSFVLPTLYSLSTLGFYSLAQRALGGPSALIGSSISQVFFQHATEEKNKTGKIIDAFDSTLKKLIFICIPIFGIIYFVVEDIFAFAFGEQWREAGMYAKILTPMFAVNFLVSAISSVDSIMEKQEYYLWFNFILLINIVFILFISPFNDFIDMLNYISISVSIIYLIYCLILRQLAKGKNDYV